MGGSEITSAFIFTDCRVEQRINLDPAPLTITISSQDVANGTTFYFGILLRGTTGRTEYFPCLGGTGIDALSGHGLAYWWSDSDQTAGADVPGSLTVAGADQRAMLQCEFTLKTSVRRPLGPVNPTQGSRRTLLIPRRVDGPFWIVLRDVRVPIPQNLSISAQRYRDGAMDNLAEIGIDFVDPCVLNFTAQGEIASLALDPAEHNCPIDLGLSLRPVQSQTRGNLFFINKQIRLHGGVGPEDYATRSHAAARDGGQRGDEYVLDEEGALPEVLVFGDTSGAHISSLEVSSQLLVLFGDSQTGTRNPNRPYGLGMALPALLSNPLPWWIAAIPGNRLTQDAIPYHTAGYKRFCHPIPGQGDLCDMYSVLFLYSGMGVNDISARVGSHSQAPIIAEECAYRVSGILDILSENCCEKQSSAMLLGLPPWLSAPDYKQEAIRLLNFELARLSCQYDCAYFDPTTLVNAHCSEYLGSNTLHYTATGYWAVASHTVQWYENNRLGMHGDLDADGTVGLCDLAALLGSYGMTSGAGYQIGDMDGDGDVDMADLAAMLGYYGFVCP